MRNFRSPQEIWEAALGELQVQVNKSNYDTWLKDTVGINYQNDQFTIGVPNAFGVEWLRNRFQSLVTKTLVSITGKRLDVHFIVHNPKENEASAATSTSQVDGGISYKTVPASRLNPKYTFYTFTVGNSNRLAYAAALGVAENPGRLYNPLFIYGDTGLGKTHLLQAVGHLATNKRLRTLYITAEQFTTEFITAIKERKTEDFRDKCRSTEMLLMDDIQFISGKEQTQEYFFHTFNDLHNANCQIILTSDRSPKTISWLDKRLRSRFEWGLTVAILPPDLVTRLTILQSKAQQMATAIPPEVLEFLARRIQKSVRQLEGALNRLDAYAKLTGARLDPQVAADVLADLTQEDSQQSPVVPPKVIIEIVASYFALPPEALTTKKRDKKTALARQIAMYLMRQENRYHLTEIGKELGGRDHSTIIHGCKRIAREMDINPQFHGQVTEIVQALKLRQKSLRTSPEM